MQDTSNPYTPDNILLYEMIYGKNLISLGGVAAIENMFSDVNLNISKALDLGFGLGGVAFYLAKKYQLHIWGIEVHQWMAEYANDHAPLDIAHLLRFDTYNELGEIPYSTGSFGLVYSKGVLNHVRDKQPLFQQINRVLKPDGSFVIADWIYSEPCIDNSSPLVKETQISYREVLEQTGFVNIHFRDDSKIFIGYVKELLRNISDHKAAIEKKFGPELFAAIWDDHQKLIDDMHYKRKFATRIKAIRL